MQHDDPELLCRAIPCARQLDGVAVVGVAGPLGRSVCRVPRDGDEHGVQDIDVDPAGTGRQARGSAVPAGDRAGAPDRQAFSLAQLRLHFPGDGHGDRGRHRRQTFQRRSDRPVFDVDRQVQPPHRPVRRHRRERPLSEKAAGSVRPGGGEGEASTVRRRKGTAGVGQFDPRLRARGRLPRHDRSRQKFVADEGKP